MELSPSIIFKSITVIPNTPETPTLKEIVIEEVKLEPEQAKVMCCSSTITKRSADYVVKITFLSISVLLSIVGLTYIELFGNPCSPMIPVLSGLLSGSLAILVPTPKRND